MEKEKFWIISECTSGDRYYYTGYYETGKPVFTIAIAEAVAIASPGSAIMLHTVLNKIVPCDILIVENNSVSKVYPL